MQNENKVLREYNNKIIECYWDSRNHVWKFMRVREDKGFPNSHVTARSKETILFCCIFVVNNCYHIYVAGFTKPSQMTQELKSNLKPNINDTCNSPEASTMWL